jgi:hypothetical protein
MAVAPCKTPSDTLHKRMGKTVDRERFRAVQSCDGLNWCVAVTLPRGISRCVDGFPSEQGARDWITRDADAWLKRTEGGKFSQAPDPPVRPLAWVGQAPARTKVTRTRSGPLATIHKNVGPTVQEREAEGALRVLLRAPEARAPNGIGRFAPATSSR